MRKACGTRFRAGREAVARPEPVPGLGMHRSLSRLQEGGSPGAPQGPPRLCSPPGAPRPAGPAAPSRAVGTGCRALGQGGRERRRDPVHKHPGKDEGGSGKLAASSRSRLRSPSFILPEIISFTENICLHY